MKITYFKGNHSNFGDELNLWLWPRILPHFFDDDDSTLFLGIGSIIGNHYSHTATKIVFGAAFVPEYYEQPAVMGDDWDIYFVRGPRTARLLNIAPGLALGDSAILLRTVVEFRQHTPEVVSFMPHWESLNAGHWEEVCHLAGFNFIDPRRPVEDVISELLRSRVVITEAMHGAIVADAFRIPWIPLFPLYKNNRDKWFDWAEALGIQLHFNRFMPSGLAEILPRCQYRPKLEPIMHTLTSCALARVIDKGIIYLAAQRLTDIAKSTPQLSDDTTMERVTESMLMKVEQLRRAYTK